MKTFKHKKTGETATYKDGILKSSGFCIELGVEPSSEFWEEVVGRDYEILSYQSVDFPEKIFRKNHSSNKNLKYLKNSWFCDQGTYINSINPGSLYTIHSIRRVSDGEVFNKANGKSNLINKINTK